MHLPMTALWPAADVQSMAHEPLGQPRCRNSNGSSPAGGVSASPAKGARHDPLEPSRALILVLGPVPERVTCSSSDSPAGAQPRGAGTRLRRSRPGPRRSRRATTSAAASRPAGGIGPRTEGGVSFLRAGAQLVTASGEQALAQRAGPIAMAGQGPVPHRPAGAGRTPPPAGCDRLRGDGRPASQGPRLSPSPTPDPVPALPTGPEFRRCPAWPARPARGVRPAPSRAAGGPSAPSASSTGGAVPHRPPAAR